MRILIFFDLPNVSLDEKKEYRNFRKFLIKKGFLMLQESVYSKLTLNQTASDNVIRMIKANKPKRGLVQILVITEKRFSKMECICGETQSSVIDSDQKVVII